MMISPPAFARGKVLATQVGKVAGAVALGLVFFALILNPAPARAGGLLGALYDTCLANLGEPHRHVSLKTPPASEVYAFRRSGWNVTVFLWKHQAHLIIYEKTDGTTVSSLEGESVLKGYGDGLEWTRDTLGHCARTDGSVQARVTADMVAIFSTAFGSVAVPARGR